jgi:uncharacterized Zn finger protein (UPF0148 family)
MTLYFSSLSFEGPCPFCGAMLIQRDNDSACPTGHYRVTVKTIGMGSGRVILTPRPSPTVPQAFHDAFEGEEVIEP